MSLRKNAEHAPAEMRLYMDDENQEILIVAEALRGEKVQPKCPLCCCTKSHTARLRWPGSPADPWATGTERVLASCRSSRQLKPTPSSSLLHEITGFQPPNLRIGVLQHPLATDCTR